MFLKAAWKSFFLNIEASSLVDIWAVYASSAHKPPFTEELLTYVKRAFETILANPVEQRAEEN